MPRVSQSVAATFAVALLCISTAPGIAAGATLRAGDGGGSVKEASHRTDIRVDGIVATVTTTQTLINTSGTARMAVYTFQVPRHAAITSLSIRTARGVTATATVVDAKAAITLAPATRGATPDVGLLRLIERETASTPITRDLLATYELRVYPIAKRRATTVKIRWVTTMRYDDGRLTLRIPGRGSDRALTRSLVTLSARAPRGIARLGAVRGGGKRLSARHGTSARKYRFSAPVADDLTIETTPIFSSSAPVVSFATVPMGRGFGAVAVSALTPLPRNPRSTGYERVFLLIDVSKSVGHKGIAAAANMTSALLAAVPPRARVEAIFFDREAKRAFGKLLPNLPDTRKIIARSLRRVKQRNGSDLGLALDVVRRILARDTLPEVPPEGIVRGNGASTLIAVITDGMIPTELTGKRAADRIGSKAIQGGEVLAITLVPDEAALPGFRSGPLSDLARRTAGRAIAVRHSEIRRRGKNLAAELNGPTELSGLSVVASNGTELRRLSLPKKIVSGGGAVRVGWYRGAPPTRLTVRGMRDRRPVRFAAKRARPGLRAAVGGIALSTREADSTLEELVVTNQATADDAIRDLVLRAGSRFRSVTKIQSLVVLANDAFSRQRKVFAKRWGSRLHRRHAAPVERGDGNAFASYTERVAVPTAAPTAAVIQGRTGSLDRRIVKRLITTYVIPRARACYEQALRRKPTLSGSLTVVMELARGEVQFAEMRNATMADAPLLACMTNAAYAVPVPRIALGATRDQVSIVRYPLRLRVAGDRARIDRGTPRKRAPLQLKGPLGGLPTR